MWLSDYGIYMPNLIHKDRTLDRNEKEVKKRDREREQKDPYFFPKNTYTLNLTEEKLGSTLEHIGTGDHFLNNPVAQTLRETINKWDLRKLKSFCKAKDTVNKTK